MGVAPTDERKQLLPRAQLPVGYTPTPSVFPVKNTTTSLIFGVLLLILSGIGIWWLFAQGQYADVKNTIHLWGVPIHLPPLLIGSSSEVKPATTQKQNTHMWLVWYGDDTAVYRLRVNTIAYSDLYTALRKSIEQDQVRMESIAGSHLSAELSPVFAELLPRIEPFLENLFAVSSSTFLVAKAIEITNEATRSALPLLENKRPQLEEHARSLLATEVVKRFQQQVLVPGFTMRALRGASGRAFMMVRQDLLENCDRYDRAFRSFVLKTPGTVESRDGVVSPTDEVGEDGGNGGASHKRNIDWHADSSWQQGNATFWSLCPELRRPNTGQLSDVPLREAFAAAEDTVRAQALELVRPLIDTAVGVALHTVYTSNLLATYGVPTVLANPLATGIGSLTHARTLLGKILEQLGGKDSSARLGNGLRITMDGLRTDSIQRLHSVYRTFIAAEMERISLNLAARSEGEWSRDADLP